MNVRERLSRRIHMGDIFEILSVAEGNKKCMEQLYRLIFDENDQVAYQALWVCSHLKSDENKWLAEKQHELIDEVMVCKHPGKRRILLNLLNRQSLKMPPRTDFLDYCLNRMASSEELPGVQTLCMKLAYELCRKTPELLNEFRLTMEMIEIGQFPISVRTVYKKCVVLSGRAVTGDSDQKTTSSQ